MIRLRIYQYLSKNKWDVTKVYLPLILLIFFISNKNSVSNDTSSEEENPSLNGTTTVEPSSNNLSGEENPKNKNPDITDPIDEPENPLDKESVIEKKEKRMSNNQQVNVICSLLLSLSKCPFH